MKKQNNGLSNATLLRQKAEEELKKKKSGTISATSENDLRKLIHELEVHEIELEMQNEELRAAKERAEQAEEKYAELYNFAPSGYLSLSKKGEITELNFAAASMLGKERLHLMNRSFAYFLSEQSRPDFNVFFRNVFAGEKKQSCELVLTTKSHADDENMPVHVNIQGVSDLNKESCHLTMVDITEKVKQNQELKKAKEKAEEADYQKSVFLANMSHEIRTPMNGILGFAELLKEPGLQEDQQLEFIDIIEQSGNRLLNIINDLIDVSKIEAGLMKVDVTETNINKQLEYIYSFFKPEVEAQGMELSYKAPLSANEATIQTDQEKVYAILTNLVKNAIKYSHEGAIVFGYTPKDEVLEFYVKDTGVGIPEDKQAAVFERFIREGHDGKKFRQGAGLGLTITKAYLEMLGGKIWLESRKGIGSTFYFTLPYKQ